MKKKLLILFLFLFTKVSIADEKMILGLKVYNDKAKCGTCHTLKAAKSNGQIGPNLDMLKTNLGQIIYVVKNGIGVMPPWDGILSDEEIKAVAYYVFNSTND